MYQEAQSVQGELDNAKEKFLAHKAIMHNSLNEPFKNIQHVGKDKEASQKKKKDVEIWQEVGKKAQQELKKDFNFLKGL